METQPTSLQSYALDKLFTEIGIGIVATNTEGCVLFSNKCAQKLLGLEADNDNLSAPAERYELFLNDGVTPCPQEQSPIYRAIQGEEADDIELLVSPKGAHLPPRWCGFNVRPLRSEDEQITGALLVIQDVTARKQLAREAARSNTALQQFASVAAHDLQEPLRSVTGFVDLLAEESKNQLDENCTHYMNRIKVSVARMRQLIGDLLTFSRIQTAPHAKTDVACQEIFERCVDNLSSQISDSGAVITAQNLPVVEADESQISQLFQNLLSNALKFVAPNTKPIVEVSAKRDGASWVFRVSDNGIGMDMRFADRIFVAFQRLHGRNAYSGTGIGLAICKGVVDRHGGNIWVQSTPGEGTDFYFTLPA